MGKHYLRLRKQTYLYKTDYLTLFWPVKKQYVGHV